MSHKLALILTDNGAIYFGEPVQGFDNCITLQHVVVKGKALYPTKEGRLSIPVYRILEIIEVDDTFQSIEQFFAFFVNKFGEKEANDTDNPSIAYAWTFKGAGKEL